jgi:hypothetical protein
MNNKLSIQERFWNKVSKTENGCWIWTAGKNGHGYGYFRVSKNKDITAHRYSFELSNGPIMDGKIICHSCDVPACVNPDHLFLGTHKDNAIDRNKKGRGKCFKKLSDDNVKIIKSSTMSQNKLSKQFGVSRRTIASIQYGETWVDVESTADVSKTFTCQICNQEASHTIHKDTNYQYRRISDELCLKCDRALKLFGSNKDYLLAAVKFLSKS